MRFIEMSDYNRVTKAYWFAMVASGFLTCLWAFSQCLFFSPIQYAQLLALTLLVIITSSYPVRIPNTRASITAGDTFIFLSLLFLGIPAAIVLGVVDSYISSSRTTKRGTSLLGAPAMMAVSTLVAGHVFYLALNFYAQISDYPLHVAPPRLDFLLVPMALMTTTHFLLNGFSVATLYALKQRRTILRFWSEGYLWTSWAFLAAAVAATLIFVAITRYGFLYVLLSVPVLAVTYATYWIYFERVNSMTQQAEALSRLHLATVEALATAIDAKDQTTHCHVRRVQIYAAGMGKVLGLSDNEIEALKAGALLHDIGKLAVPDQILNKPGRLTSAEFEKMKVHTTVGAEILERVDFPYPVVPIVRHHHEQWDGHGYPDGLRGEAIPVTARIISVVDCFDSVREERPFRRGMTRDEAAALLLRGAGTHFDPKVVDLFLKNLTRFEFEITSQGLDEHALPGLDRAGHIVGNADIHLSKERGSSLAYDQIKNAHREVYSLYEIARTFGSSLDLEDTLSILVNKVGHIVPFDTCAVYLFDDLKNLATAAHVVGKNAEALRNRCIAPGEGVTGFALANRRAINRIHPMLDLVGLELSAGDSDYRAMAALPLIKDDHLIGAISVYSLELGEYTDDHMRLLETVTRLASDALSNAMHHAEANSNALTDPLTSLPNARSMYARFEQEAARARRTRRPFQVVMLDLDDFKQVNDTFGHKIGDVMLREVAHIVQAQLREYDFLARYAGDEFVAILQDLPADQVEDLRGRIESAVSKFSLHVQDEDYAHVGISVGTSTYGADGETLDQLLICADQAMYRDKSIHKQKRRRHDVTAELEPHLDMPTGKLDSAAIN